MFHAAEALISERTGRAAKTHSGVRSLFAQSTKDLPGSDRGLARTLAKAYGHEEFADFGTDPARFVADEAAAESIAAEHFIARVAALLSAPHPGANG